MSTQSIEDRIATLEEKQEVQGQMVEQILKQLVENVNKINDEIKSIKEIVIAWNNMKGFVSVAIFLLKAGSIAAAIGASLYIFLKTGKISLPELPK